MPQLSGCQKKLRHGQHRQQGAAHTLAYHRHTRFPFAVPDHPLIEAHIEASGSNAFGDFSLPEAILKFRQGMGQLIRTKSDKGIVVVLDNRVLTKRYGQTFLVAIPKCPVEVV